MKISSIQEADAVFDRFAVVQARISAVKADLKDRIAKMKSDAEAALSADVAIAAELETALREFCEAEENRPYFANPRKRKCENGSYGLQTSTEVATDRDFDADAETRRIGTELCKRSVKPDLTLIKDALINGEDIHGARLEVKECFKYSLRGN
ncbi:MAG: host-nuclease inhibitor Gam family protein [Lentisphaeria bacterium]|nr:host-nuclease inhibitor Gam family protein [Lentisphaeria bacterium]